MNASLGRVALRVLVGCVLVFGANGVGFGQVVINEIMYDPNPPAPSVAGEWFELYNDGNSPVDLEDWTFSDAGSNPNTFTISGNLMIGAKGYLVLGRNSDTSANGGVPKVDYEYGTAFSLANGDDEIIMVDNTNNEMDRVEYDVNPWPLGNGASIALKTTTDYQTFDNNDPTNWCVSTKEYGTGARGTPRAANDCPLPNIVINEIMHNPSQVADSAGEWIELYNAGVGAVDINGWVIEDDGVATETHTISVAGGLSIAAGEYLVLGPDDSTATNGGVTVDYEYTTIELGDDSDGLVLKDGSVERDRVVWDNGATFPDPSGASMSLKSPDLDNADGANWCAATATYGDGDRGTPGSANDCIRFTGEIFEIQGSDRDSPHMGAVATTNDNIVTAVGAGGFFMQTPTNRSDSDANTSDGIFVVHSGTPVVMVGDQVDVVGRVLDGAGEEAERSTWYFTRIDATNTVGSVTFDASNQTLPEPVEFNASRPSPNPRLPSCKWEYECYEGMRVRIASGTVASGNQRWPGDSVAEMFITATSSRPFREPGIEYPGLPGLPVWDGNPEVFELDPDRLGLTNVSWDPGTTFSATGVLAYEHFDYELWPTELTLQAAGPTLPRAVRAKESGEITVASLNLLNLGASADATKLGKLSGYIREVLGSPDIVGVQEALGLTALQNLATRIATDDSNVSYTARVEASGTSQAVGFLVRSGVTINSVTEHGRSETFIDPRSGSVVALNDRPPLVLDATVGEFAFSVIVIHSRSLIGIDDAASGEFRRVKRLEQAQSLARLVESRQDSKLIVVGDYNAYEFTDGYADVVGQISGKVTPSENLHSGPDLVTRDLCVLTERVPASDRYSTLFQGSAQVLDHALVNQALERHVVEMQFARGNADAAFDDEDDATNVLRNSDHDGFVVYLSSDAKPPVNPSPCQAPLPPGTPAMADLDLDAESQVVSASRIRFNVKVENAGPDIARDVVVTSSFSGAAASMEASTSGCGEDPDGVPECSLGDIAAGDAASFTIDVDTGGARETSLGYSGSVGSDASDPSPRDDDVRMVQPLGPPNAPTDLVAAAIGSTEIELRWQDNSRAETEFDVFLQGPGDSRLRLIGSVPANTTTTVVDELVPNIRYNFAVEARNGPLRSGRTPTSTATTWWSDAAGCGEDDVLCLGSFEVEVEWTTRDGETGRGIAERLTAESGDFWFFHPANIEMVIKVLDGCRIDGHYWVFAAGLTDVEVTTTVRDLRTGLEMSWTNPQGTLFEPISDMSAFATCGEASRTNGASRIRLSGAPKDRAADLYRASLTEVDRVAAAGSECAESETALCLQNSRYQVRANWHTGEQSGAATAIPRTSDTGMFWFFSSDNVELIVKVLDGCALNGHRWVLMGGLTDVGVEIIVTDTESDETKVYESPGGSLFSTRFDTTAFSCSTGR